MTQELVRSPQPGLPAQIADRLPPMVASGERTVWRFADFFAVTIRDPNTREAYYRAVCRFMDWCERRGLHGLGDVMPIHVAAYVEQLPLSQGLDQAAPLCHQSVASIGWCRVGSSRPTRRRRSRDPGTS